jgi:hypothetical protein
LAITFEAVVMYSTSPDLPRGAFTTFGADGFAAFFAVFLVAMDFSYGVGQTGMRNVRH